MSPWRALLGKSLVGDGGIYNAAPAPNNMRLVKFTGILVVSDNEGILTAEKIPKGGRLVFRQ